MPVVFKPNVNFTVIPQITDALNRIDSIFTSYGFQAVVTSANDSVHAPRSAHYYGAAIDIRTKGLPSKIKTVIYQSLKKILAPLPPWFVNLEFQGKLQEHIHIQYGVSVKNKAGQIVGFTDGQKIIY